jgi:putative lipoprotein
MDWRPFILSFAVTSCSVPHTQATQYRGIIVLGPEVETFTPCGSREPLWLDGPEELLRELQARYQQQATSPYQGMFAALEGDVRPKLDCGFCKDYEGSFRVRKVAEFRVFREGDC